jgi:hypothetical protein
LDPTGTSASVHQCHHIWLQQTSESHYLSSAIRIPCRVLSRPTLIQNHREKELCMAAPRNSVVLFFSVWQQ